VSRGHVCGWRERVCAAAAGCALLTAGKSVPWCSSAVAAESGAGDERCASWCARPGNAGGIEMPSLDQLRPGQAGRIDRGRRRRSRAAPVGDGPVRGETGEVVGVAPLGDPLELRRALHPDAQATGVADADGMPSCCVLTPRSERRGQSRQAALQGRPAARRRRLPRPPSNRPISNRRCTRASSPANDSMRPPVRRS